MSDPANSSAPGGSSDLTTSGPPVVPDMNTRVAQLEALLAAQSNHITELQTFATAAQEAQQLAQQQAQLAQQHAQQQEAEHLAQQQAQQQQQAQLQAQQVQQPFPAAPPPTTQVRVSQNSIKLPTFSNASGEDIQSWIDVAEIRMEAEACTEMQRLSAVLDALKKEPLSNVMRYIRGKDRTQITWAELRDLLSRTYASKSAKTVAIDKLETMRYGGNLSAYISEFRDYANQAGLPLENAEWAQTVLQRWFCRPLPDDLKLYIYKLGSHLKPDDMFQAALDWNAAAIQTRNLPGSTARPSRHHQPSVILPAISRVPQIAAGGDRMDLDAIGEQGNSAQGRQPAPRACHACGRTGHLWRACRNPRPGFKPPVSSNQVAAITPVDVALVQQTKVVNATVPATVQGTSFNLLLDSGAAANFVHPRVLKKVRGIMWPSNREWKLADEALRTTSNETQLEFEVGSKKHHFTAKFHVADWLKQDAILGVAWLQQHQLVPDWTLDSVWSKAAQKTPPSSNEQDVVAAVQPSADDEIKLPALAGDAWSRLPATERQAAERLLQEHKNLFKAPGMPPARSVDHTIDTGTARPIRQADRPRSPLQHKVIDDFVEENLKTGFIRPSSSPWASPIHLVRKSDGTYRPCIDYRRLNSVTVKDAYPLPRIDDAFQYLQGKTIFSSLDLKSGYYQVRVADADIQKTAFPTRHGLFEFAVMPFGLCNAPSTFQRTMNDALRGLLGISVVCYLDDLLVFSDNVESHLLHLRQVFERLQENSFHLHPAKCNLLQSSVRFLGHVVSATGITADPAKIAKVREWPTPTTGSQLRSFLGFAGYYRRLVKDYAKLSAPLYARQQDSGRLEWTPDMEKAMAQLKDALTTPPTLAFPVPGESFFLETDASGTALAAILSQESETQGGRRSGSLSLSNHAN